jgi:two-component system response regulator YesN
MFQILIVDDEQVERDGIAFLIQKFDLKLQISQAENGEEALAITRTQPIDILFTDIKMPFMDGLELAEHIRVEQPQTVIVIYSAFNEFEYARKAVNVQAFHYILKPIEVKEFLDVMDKVIALCEEQRREDNRIYELQQGYEMGVKLEKDKLLLDILAGSPWNEVLQNRLHYIGLDSQEGWWCPLLLDMSGRWFDSEGMGLEQELQQQSSFPFDYVNMNEFQSILLWRLGGRDVPQSELASAAAQLQRYIRGKSGIRSIMIIGRPMGSLSDLYEQVERMEALLEYKFFSDEDAVYGLELQAELNNRPSDFIEKALNQMKGYAEAGQLQPLLLRVDLFFRELKSWDSLSIMYVKYAFYEIIRAVLTAEHLGGLQEFSMYADKVFKSRHVDELRQVLMSVLEREAVVIEGDEAGRKVIEDVRAVLEREYAEDLGLDQLAARVYLSPSYLSHLFKKETGISLIKYLTNYRVEKAKELLCGTNMKIAQISKEVGYRNYSYFCSLFKNYTGMTPAQLREKGQP